MRNAMRCVFASLLIAPALLAETPGNLTGTWYLNVDKSQWGSAKKPVSVVLKMEHKEPAIRYSGTVSYVNEDTRDFAFDGAIDGTSYPMTRSYGAGTAVLRRVDAGTFEAVFRTADGAYVETARTSLSKNGTTLTRKVNLKTPQGSSAWTEIYERH